MVGPDLKLVVGRTEYSEDNDQEAVAQLPVVWEVDVRFEEDVHKAPTDLRIGCPILD